MVCLGSFLVSVFTRITLDNASAREYNIFDMKYL